MVVLLYRLVRLDHDAATANRTVWFLAIFPTAYILHIGYTESLFISLVLGAFLAARAGRWPLVALLGALACLTRVNGLLLIPALAIEPALHLWRTRRFDRRWLWLAAIPLGFGGYLLLNYRVTGDPFAFLAITRERWFKSFAPPWTGIAAMFESLSWRPPFEIWTVIWQQALFIVHRDRRRGGGVALAATILCGLDRAEPSPLHQHLVHPQRAALQPDPLPATTPLRPASPTTTLAQCPHRVLAADADAAGDPFPDAAGDGLLRLSHGGGECRTHIGHLRLATIVPM